MANLDAPFGFRVCRHLSGGTPGRMSEYEIQSGLAENIFTGAMVNSDGAGRVKEAAADEVILGVFGGVKWVNSDGEVRFARHWASGTTVKSGDKALALVYDDPMLTFEAQASGEVLAADVGLLADLNVPSPSGDTDTGSSLMEVGAHDGSETQLKILRVLEKPQRTSTGGYQYSAAGTNALVEVRIARHELGFGSTTVEV